MNRRALLLLPALIALLAHPRALAVPWLWDDHALLAALDAHGAWGAAFGGYLGEYLRPIVLLMLAAERGLGPAAAHGVNLALHAGTAAGLATWLRREGVSLPASTAAAALWAALPLHAEAVLWASARGDLVVGLCAVLGLHAVARGGPRAALWAGLCAGTAALALERGVMVAPLLALRALWGRPARERRWDVVAACAAAGALWVGLRAWVLGALPAPEFAVTGLDRLGLLGAAAASAGARSLWPLTPDLAVGVQGPVASVGPALAAAVGALVLAAGAARVRGAAGFGIAAWALLLLPSLHLVPLQVFPLHADRYLYAPWLGLALTVGAALDALSPSRRRLGLAVAAAATLLAGTTSAVRGSAYLDEETFFRVLAAEAEPGNAQPAYTLGDHLARTGRCPEAEPILRRALATFDAQGREVSAAGVLARLGICALDAGDPQGALPLLRAAAEQQRGDDVRGALARALLEGGAWDDAEAAIDALVRDFPASPAGYGLRSRLAAARLAFPDAIDALDAARARAGAPGSSPLRDRLVAAAAEARAARERGDGPALQALAREWSPHP